MELFTRNSPAYKSGRFSKHAVATQPAATSGLSGLIESLFGSATPAYRTLAGRDAKASVPSKGLLSMFAVAPSYKAAQMAAIVDETPLESDSFAEAGDPGIDDEGAICVRTTDEIVLL